MKFVSNKHAFNVYGYTFKPGETVDVKESNLIQKFRRYDWLKEVRDRGNKSATKKQSIKETTSA